MWMYFSFNKKEEEYEEVEEKVKYKEELENKK